MDKPEAEVEHCVVAVWELSQRKREDVLEMAEDQ